MRCRSRVEAPSLPYLELPADPDFRTPRRLVRREPPRQLNAKFGSRVEPVADRGLGVAREITVRAVDHRYRRTEKTRHLEWRDPFCRAGARCPLASKVVPVFAAAAAR